jgi:hypothetical protein
VLLKIAPVGGTTGAIMHPEMKISASKHNNNFTK